MVTITVRYLVSNKGYHGLVVREHRMVMKAHSQVRLAFGYAPVVAQFARYKSLQSLTVLTLVFRVLHRYKNESNGATTARLKAGVASTNRSNNDGSHVAKNEIHDMKINE